LGRKAKKEDTIMKKIISVLAVFLLMIMVSVPALANTVLTFTVDSNITAAKGGEVRVPIRVSGNPGFAAVGLELRYDPRVLQFLRYESNAITHNQGDPNSSPAGTLWIHMFSNVHGAGPLNWDDNGVLIVAVFRVDANALDGPSGIGLAFTGSPDGTPANADAQLITNAVTYAGSVIVSGTATGGGGGGGGGDGGWDGGGWDGGGGGGGGNVGTPAQPGYDYSGGNIWTIDSWANLVQVIQMDFSRFRSVHVNNTTLTPDVEFNARSGSTVITIFASYLNTLPLGQHTLEVRFSEGVNVRSQFTIVEPMVSQPPQPPEQPGPDEPDGGFIGNPYDPDAPPEVGSAGGGGGSGGGGGQGFGVVPKTGVPSIIGAVIALGASFLALVALCTHVFRRVSTLLKSPGSRA